MTLVKFAFVGIAANFMIDGGTFNSDYCIVFPCQCHSAGMAKIRTQTKITGLMFTLQYRSFLLVMYSAAPTACMNIIRKDNRKSKKGGYKHRVTDSGETTLDEEPTENAGS